MNTERLHHIIIVGGGAGGLELATRLGDKLGKRKKAAVTLVDSSMTHLWKPLLHEVAAGSLNSYEDELGYLGQAYWHNFQFRLGSMDSLDRGRRVISLRPSVDENDREYIPRRDFHYDTLVLAVGGVTNDFGINGVSEHCMFLDNRQQADAFHQSLLKNFYSAHTQKQTIREGQLHIAIAGGGATGVELAAELRESVLQLRRFGLDNINLRSDVRITIVEGSDRILPALPKELSEKTAEALAKLGVEVRSNTLITEATADAFITSDGLSVPAAIKVWAAGVKAPDFLGDIEGLETNTINQLLVRSTLQTTMDDDIFALGDCAACPLSDLDGDANAPPRAQAAHQQADMLVRSLQLRVKGGTALPRYRYVDFGSMVNIGRYTTVGSLMGNVSRLSGSMMLEGLIARLVYLSLYKMHQLALHGFIRTSLSTLANFLTRRYRPRMKLH